MAAVRNLLDRVMLLDLFGGLGITFRNLWKKKAQPKKLLTRFGRNRFYHLMAGEDEREGGAILYFHLPRPLKITGSSREYPSPVYFAPPGK